MKFQFTFKGSDPSGAKGSQVQGHASQEDAAPKQDRFQQRMKELVRDKTEKRFDRILSPEEGHATVMTTREKNNWILLEMTVKALGDSFMGSDKLVENATNMEQLVDTVLSKIERQLLKRKEMQKERWKQRNIQD